MGIIGSFFSGIREGVSTIAEGVGKIVSTVSETFKPVAEAIGKVATSIGGKLAVKVASFIPVVGNITNVVTTVCEVAKDIGVFDEDDKLEEVGMKAEVAEKKTEDFKGTEEYISYLRNDVEVDEEKLSNLDKDEAIAYMTVGAAIALNGISEKLETNIEPSFIRDVIKIGMKSPMIKNFIVNFRENGATTNLEDYFKGELSAKQSNKVNMALETGIKKAFPEISENEMFDKITIMREEYFKKIEE